MCYNNNVVKRSAPYLTRGIVYEDKTVGIAQRGGSSSPHYLAQNFLKKFKKNT